MTFQPSMQFHVQGLELVSEGKWRNFDGMVGSVLEVASEDGAHGYFKYDEPRIAIHLEDVASWMDVSVDSTAQGRRRPVLQAAFIPAGVPWWITCKAKHRFSHLNVYMHEDRLIRYLSPALGRSAARAAIRSPIDVEDPCSLMSLVKLLSDDIATPKYHPIYAENLVGSIVASLFAPRDRQPDLPIRKLTAAQLEKVVTCLETGFPGRVPVGEMAGAVGMSDSRFAQIFKDTTGATPLEWQRIRRIEKVKTMLRDSDLPLAEVAYQLGFTDQSHMTKVFKQMVGMGPAAWRLSQK